MSKFAEVMKSLEEMTLPEIDSEIQALETEMAAAVEPLLKKRNALSVLRKIVAASCGEPVVKKTRKPRKASGSDGESTNRAPTIADRISTALQASGQPMRVKDLETATGLSYGQIYTSLSQRSNLFRKVSEGQFALR